MAGVVNRVRSDAGTVKLVPGQDGTQTPTKPARTNPHPVVLQRIREARAQGG